MKKSTLRKAIRESINKLIKEQPLPIITPCDADCMQIFDCKNWLASITQLPPFSSSNPNQPCQYLTNRIDHFQNQMANMNPTGPWYAQKACKVAAFQFLCQQNNCPNC
jgi:hypothetical protein